MAVAKLRILEKAKIFSESDELFGDFVRLSI
jgi:hypothetical protein